MKRLQLFQQGTGTKLQKRFEEYFSLLSTTFYVNHFLKKTSTALENSPINLEGSSKKPRKKTGKKSTRKPIKNDNENEFKNKVNEEFFLYKKQNNIHHNDNEFNGFGGRLNSCLLFQQFERNLSVKSTSLFTMQLQHQLSIQQQELIQQLQLVQRQYLIHQGFHKPLQLDFQSQMHRSKSPMNLMSAVVQNHQNNQSSPNPHSSNHHQHHHHHHHQHHQHQQQQQQQNQQRILSHPTDSNHQHSMQLEHHQDQQSSPQLHQQMQQQPQPQQQQQTSPKSSTNKKKTKDELNILMINSNEDKDDSSPSQDHRSSVPVNDNTNTNTNTDIDTCQTVFNTDLNNEPDKKSNASDKLIRCNTPPEIKSDFDCDQQQDTPSSEHVYSTVPGNGDTIWSTETLNSDFISSSNLLINFFGFFFKSKSSSVELIISCPVNVLFCLSFPFKKKKSNFLVQTNTFESKLSTANQFFFWLKGIQH